jgi:hypothetical protein
MWQSPQIIPLILGSLGAGLFLGYFLTRLVSVGQIKASQAKAKQLLDDADREIENKKKRG